MPFHIRRTRANGAHLAMFRPGFRGDDTARATDRLRVLDLDGRPRGEAMDLDAHGALVVSTGAGMLTVSAGDVVHVRPVG